MIKSKKQSFIIIGVFALVLMLGTVTYAFFNYTRTGTANTIRTGRISFNTSQSNTLNLTNVFPMSSTDAENANLDAVSIRIWGDTTYADGEEFEISIVDVNNTIGSGASAKTIPINYIASYTATPVQSGDPNVIGTNSDSYFTARGQSSPVYQLKTTGEATNGEQVLIGYIPSGAVGVDGTLTIKAYLDSSKIAISDTYPTEETDTNSDGYIDGTPASFGEGKIVLTTSEWNALQNTQTPLSFKIKAVSQEGIWVKQIPVMSLSSSSGTVTAGSNTTATITTTGDGIITCQSSDTTTATCSVDTTNNTLTVNGVAEGSATITVNQAAGANYEGISTLYSITVEELPTIETCPGCVYMYTTNQYHFGENGETIEYIENAGDTYTNNYLDIVKEYGNIFLGMKIENGKIAKGYICGIKGEEPNEGLAFCIDVNSSGDTLNANSSYIRTIYDNCVHGSQSYVGVRTKCEGKVTAFVNTTVYNIIPQQYLKQTVYASADRTNYCYVQSNYFTCKNENWTGA